MTGVSEMKLIHYKVIKTFFQLNHDYEPKNDKISIQPEFRRTLNIIDNQHYSVTLSVAITKEKNKVSIPFIAEAEIFATFELIDWETDETRSIALHNATAILFPYLRNLLSTITLNGNVPPYTLPIMNINKLFNE